MEREELNVYLLIITGALVSAAIALLLFLYCRSQCQGRSGRTPRGGHSGSPSKQPLKLSIPDMEFIDEKQTPLVSSTIQVSSIHNSPQQNNV